MTAETSASRAAPKPDRDSDSDADYHIVRGSDSPSDSPLVCLTDSPIVSLSGSPSGSPSVRVAAPPSVPLAGPHIDAGVGPRVGRGLGQRLGSSSGLQAVLERTLQGEPQPLESWPDSATRIASEVRSPVRRLATLSLEHPITPPRSWHPAITPVARMRLNEEGSVGWAAVLE
jgi:hypothetical protein